MSELSNFNKLNFYFFLKKNVNIDFERCEFSRAVKLILIFAAASPTLYYRFEPKLYANFRQSEVFLNCNIHHTS